MGTMQFNLQVTAGILGFIALFWVLTKGYLLIGTYLASYATKPPVSTQASSCDVGAGPANCQRLTVYAGTVFIVTFIIGQKDPLIAVTVPLAIILALSAYVDYYTQKLPDKLTALAALSLLTGVGLTLIIAPVPYPLGLLYSAALGALVWALPLAVIYYGLKGLGLGDLKLAPVIGAWLGLYGFEVSYTGLLLAFTLGGVVALSLVILKKLKLKDRIPYGPFLVVGAYLVWAAHVSLL
ncbi:prepilin peptidase [Gleimia sp. 6138-11-ORH1]|uniref:prepilin peptidase n=1 Tax=Gleimia sp. 6138-11-ORH1 TaxID=2973937 RepID=UPI00216A9802|nr:prepilin peptidase [Gleimia sp. 6138-11-ORH1]MCS4484389.1 prepilin peptidase [Gleimia sp. 6138-11-ORH1]